MANLNPRNIDELMRRAAEDYPLRTTDSSDWDKLAGELDSHPGLILPSAVVGGRTRRRRWFWLLLLIPLGGLFYYIAGKHGEALPKQTQVAGTGGKAFSGTRPEAASGARQDAAGGGQEDIPGGGSAITGAGEEKKVSADKASVDKTGADKVNADKAGAESAGADKLALIRQEDMGGIAGAAKNGDGTRGFKGKKDAGGKEDAGSIGNSEKPGHVGRGNLSFADFHLRPAGVGESGQVNFMVRGTGGLPDTGVGSASKNGAKAKSKGKQRQSYFYAGVLAAPDMSMVKFQSVNRVGYSIGALLGYRINKRWSVETGLYYDKKKYYSDGADFNKSKVPGLAYANLLEVDGACNMLEIPVNIRYDLNQGGSIRWFALAGASTYLMSGEQYAYSYEQFGWTYSGSAKYPQASQYWFSMIDLSVGFEKKIGKVGNLRVAPYLRIPTAGIGIGSLPVMSTGINIGITRKLW